MTVLTLQVIWKNPLLTLHEICKSFPKFQKRPWYIATSILPQNVQETAVTICSKKFGCPSQESLPKFKENLFLMTAFKVYHMCREHGEGSSKIGGVEGASFNVWELWGEGLPRKRKRESIGGGLPGKRKISS